jgi:hypothetical protein
VGCAGWMESAAQLHLSLQIESASNTSRSLAEPYAIARIGRPLLRPFRTVPDYPATESPSFRVEATPNVKPSPVVPDESYSPRAGLPRLT